jgi:hypothetical protein
VQLGHQRLGEQPVVAVPLPVVVERHEEEFPLGDVGQPSGGVGGARTVVVLLAIALP